MQNFRTRSIPLTQAQYELVEMFPTYPPYPGAEPFLAYTYRVVDVVMADGCRLAGQLVLGDELLVHEDEPEFGAEDIVMIEPTPPERHPDFTITDRAALYLPGGDAIEGGNGNRLGLFGPPKPEKDWRAVGTEEAHDEALRDYSRVHTYGGELPASVHGIQDVRLVPGGIEVSLASVQSSRHERIMLRPQQRDVWDELLVSSFTIDPATTLADLIALLDLPPSVAAMVYYRTVGHLRWGATEPGFGSWVEAVRATKIPEDTDIEAILVVSYADLDDDTYRLRFSASGLGHPYKADDPRIGIRAGYRDHYGLEYIGPAALRNKPLRYDATLVFPVDHETQMAYYRGEWRAWSDGGEVGPEPEMPVAFRTKRQITFGEFLGAVFGELAPENPEEDE